MKICKDCKAHLDDMHSFCPECGCESFETEGKPEKAEESVKDAENSAESPTIVMDAIKVEEKADEPEASADAEENAELTMKYGVMQAPTFVVVSGDSFKKYANVSNIKKYVTEKITV